MNLHATLLSELQKGEPVVVAGLSEGTLVRGWTIRFIGQTFAPVPESQYDVVVVNEQWDGWALPPDRPWHVLAVADAVIGAFITIGGFNDHTQSALDSVSQAVLMSETVNSRGGATTTYMVPREELPITRALRQLGIPDAFVDEIDKLLMPFIAAGYSYLTPNLGPRIEQGNLVFTPPPTPPAPDVPVPPASAAVESSEPDVEPETAKPAEDEATPEAPDVLSTNVTRKPPRTVHDRPKVAESAAKLRQYRDAQFRTSPGEPAKPADKPDSDSGTSDSAAA